MNQELKKQFENNLPKEAKKLENLTTSEQKKEYTSKLLKERHNKLTSNLSELQRKDEIDQQSVFNTSSYEPLHFSLTLEKYKKLKNARARQIKVEITNLVKNVLQIQTQLQCGENSLEDILKETGILGIGPVSLTSLYSEVKDSLLKPVESIVSDYSGLKINVVESIAATLAITVADKLLSKDSLVIMFIFNELDSELINVNSEAIHGEIITTTNPIPGIKMASDQSPIISGGLFIGQKYNYAPIGAQVGWKFKSKGHQVSFASECPFNHWYYSNNCYCGFDISAREAANLTDKYHNQSSFASSDGVAAEIRVHSTSDSTAYSIGRIYNPSKKL